jgi:oxygen-independent coproporphyrinogen-3 oxidase
MTFKREGAVQTPSNLFRKYDVPAPRYTSYPTVPYWTERPTTEQWLHEVRKTAASEAASWSIYIHIPFCETLCTFCGCNTSITKDHDREEPYTQLIHRELEAYLQAVPDLLKRPLAQLHLGGGTPTFLRSANLRRLVEPILSKIPIERSGFEGAVEVDPRRTTREQLETLKSLGFTRVSMGVQDFNPEVQRLINRIQPLEVTESMTRWCRELGFESVNFDLIYGLPQQTLETVETMANETVRLRPDRIALYSFALVPWIKPQQRLFKDEDLPVGEEKRRLYEKAREILLAGGYIEIGMDHFALPTDALALASRDRRLHRNFMGYTDQRTDILIGLGVSAIGEAPGCFHQNEKVHPLYEKRVKEGQIPTLRGHVLSEEDRRQRQQILRFMAEGRVKLHGKEQEEDVRLFLEPLLQDGLVAIVSGELRLTDAGRPFLRNACMALDLRLRRAQPSAKVFSSAL